MRSPQEKLLKAISDHSLGRDYIFEPDEYKKGTATREPADLVWACNNCLILMYMCQRKIKERTPEHHAQMRKSMISHNFTQAKGWLNQWRKNGRNLVGTNNYQQFDIAHSDYRHVFILSVIDCNDNQAEFHYDQTREMNVAACITFPNQALVDIADRGGSIVEVLYLIQETVASYHYFGETIDAVETIAEKLDLSREMSGLESYVRNKPEMKDIVDQTYLELLKLRAPSILANNVGYNVTNISTGMPIYKVLPIWGLGAILNDLPLINIYELTWKITDMVQKIGADNETLFYIEIQTINHYWISIYLNSRLRLATDRFPFEIEFIEKVATDNNIRAGLMILWNSEPGRNQVAVIPKYSISFMEELAEEIVRLRDYRHYR